HRAFDRVLDRDEADFCVAALDRADHVGNRAQRLELLVGEVGLGEDRLFGERAVRAEESDSGHAEIVVARRSITRLIQVSAGCLNRSAYTRPRRSSGTLSGSASFWSAMPCESASTAIAI